MAYMRFWPSGLGIWSQKILNPLKMRKLKSMAYMRFWPSGHGIWALLGKNILAYNYLVYMRFRSSGPSLLLYEVIIPHILCICEVLILLALYLWGLLPQGHHLGHLRTSLSGPSIHWSIHRCILWANISVVKRICIPRPSSYLFLCHLYIGGVHHPVLMWSFHPHGLESSVLTPAGEILNLTLPSRSFGFEPSGRTPEGRFEALYVFFFFFF